MNKSMFATLATAAALAAGGVALAQSPAGTSSSNDVAPKSSTPGAGCTATGNAMSAGNLGGNATNKACDTTTSATPAAAATTTTTTTSPTASTAPSSADTSTSTAASTPPSADTTAASSATSTSRTRVARADRG